MKTYRVVIVGPAQKQWRNYYDCILNSCGQQPADNTQADLRATIVDLMRTAGSRPLYLKNRLPLQWDIVASISWKVITFSCFTEWSVMKPSSNMWPISAEACER